jgi:hypothetical protein
MKNYMKKLIVASFVLVSLLGSGNVSASGWNSLPADCPLALSIGNYTTGDGIQNGSNGCWTKTSIGANQGEVINIAVYYDNTNNANANNVMINLTQTPPGSMSTTNSTYTFAGNLTSSVGNLTLSQVTANLTSSQTLVFGQAKWFKNGTGSGISLPNGQTGYEAFTGGLSMGTINNGDWGNIVFSFTVGTSGGGGGGGSVCTISNFTANGSSNVYIQPGDQVNLAWSTSNCTSATISGPNGNISNSLSGNSNIYPSTSGTYTISAYGANGSAPSRNVYVSVNNTQNNNCYINTFTGNNSNSVYIQYNDPVYLVWNTSGCNYVNLSGQGVTSNNSTNGTQTVYPTYSGNYTLTAYSYNGNSQTRTIYVTVNGNQQNSCYINNFTANGSTNAYINSGAAVNFVWNTNGCSSVNVSGPNLNSYQSSGYQTIYPTYSGTYRITAYGYNGSAPSQTVYVTVNPVIINPPVYNACAVTTVATNVTQTSATLNGLLTGSNGTSYFEYGTTINLGSQTTARLASGSFSELVSGLSPNTPYFFRFVSQCGSGLSYGKIEVFQTLGNVVNTPVRPIIVQGTTVIGTQSPIMLKIENRYQYIGVGDTVDYTVTYKNIGKSKLTHPILQVVVPKGITITNSSAGTYRTDTNTLTVELQDLNPKDEGVTYLQGVVNSIDSDTAQVVTTAILVYTNPNGAQENAIAYVLNTPKATGNVLGASAFWTGLQNMGLIGWLLLVILILLIILVTRRYNNKSTVHTTSPLGDRTTTTTHY